MPTVVLFLYTETRTSPAHLSIKVLAFIIKYLLNTHKVQIIGLENECSEAYSQ